jgi:trigger factor
MNISREQIDDLNAVVKVNIEKEDYQEKVDRILKDYRKTANIPGFRKGRVPMGLVKKQYGQAVLVDEVNKLLQENIQKYLTEEKLDVLGQPLPKEQQDFNWDKDDYLFEFELGLAPEFDVKLDREEPITQYKIIAGDEMIDNQVETMRKQYGKMVPQEKVEKDFMVRGQFKNEENDIEHETTLTILDPKEDAKSKTLMDKKVGDVVQLNVKDVTEDADQMVAQFGIAKEQAEDLDLKKIDFEIKEINKQEMAELNQELFDKLFSEGKVSSEKEMREHIKEDAEKQFEQQADQKLLNNVTETLIGEADFDLPKKFLQKWIQVNGEQELDANEAKEEYEKSEKGLRFQLIESKLIKENNLQVEMEEVKAMTRERVQMQMAQFGQQMGDEEIDGIVERVLSNEEEAQKISEQAMNKKLLDFYKNNITLQEKEITYENFVKEVYE